MGVPFCAAITSELCSFYISFSFLDETDGEVPQLLEVVGCIIFISPLESEPLDIFLDGFHIFHVFFGRVGVVETQVTYSTIACGYPKIQANGLGMTDVEITVGLRRETGLDFSSVFTLPSGRSLLPVR